MGRGWDLDTGVIMQKKQVQEIVLVISLLGIFSLEALPTDFPQEKEAAQELHTETEQESSDNQSCKTEKDLWEEDDIDLDEIAFEVRNDKHDEREATFTDTVWIGVLFMKYYLFTVPLEKISQYSKWTIKYLNFTKDLNDNSSQPKNS